MSTLVKISQRHYRKTDGSSMWLFVHAAANRSKNLSLQQPHPLTLMPGSYMCV